MIELRDFNPVELLETDIDVIEYLNNAYNDEDPDIFIIALGNVVKNKGVTKVAKKAGLNRESLYKVFRGEAKPQWDTVQKLLKALELDLYIDAAA